MSSKKKYYEVVYPEGTEEITGFLPYRYDKLPEELAKEIIEVYQSVALESLEVVDIVLLKKCRSRKTGGYQVGPDITIYS